MEMQLSARDYRENWLDACRLLDEREAEIERLREALKPFAAIDLLEHRMPPEFAMLVLRARGVFTHRTGEKNGT